MPRPEKPPPDLFVALLRGINVGGKNKLPMKDLVVLFERAGARDVQTYIQSGNVVYRIAASRGAGLGDAVSRAILERHGLRVPVVTRSAREFSEIGRRHPLQQGADPKTLHVAFLADAPEPSQVRSLDPDRSPPDRFVLRGREIYLSVPNGIAKSKFTNAYFDRVLQTTSTVRNWRTVAELVAMTSAGGPT